MTCASVSTLSFSDIDPMTCAVTDRSASERSADDMLRIVFSTIPRMKLMYSPFLFYSTLHAGSEHTA